MRRRTTGEYVKAPEGTYFVRDEIPSIATPDEIDSYYAWRARLRPGPPPDSTTVLADRIRMAEWDLCVAEAVCARLRKEIPQLRNQLKQMRENQ